MALIASMTAISIPSLSASISTITSSSIPAISALASFPSSSSVALLPSHPTVPIIILSPPPPTPDPADPPTPVTPPALQTAGTFTSIETIHSCSCVHWPSMENLDRHDLRPVDIFGPRPHHVIWPHEHAPSGSRYCPEADAYIPNEAFYTVRAIKRMSSYPHIWNKLMSKIKRRKNTNMLNMVVVMGVSHANIQLISLKEARWRPEIVYGGFDRRETESRMASGSR